ncbi:hypothetical protein ACGFY0_45190, partial [Streptomyces chartreusis]|uniref:hypothetical protein n=1 Tax=Streptomyces chartreusis TaxID=1969 RepID=UPI00371999B0
IAWQDSGATAEKVLAALRIVPATALDREHAQAVIERLAKGPKVDAAPDQQNEETTGPNETSGS